MKNIYIDTNIFLHCKNIYQITWEDVFDSEAEIKVIVPRKVQQQIDELKQDGNNRRARRARAANTTLAKILLDEENKIIIREKNPYVELTFHPFVRSLKRKPPNLNENKSDDQIILEILAFMQEFPSSDVCLLSHDTGILFSAKEHNINFKKIPDSWLLPIQKDSRDKKIALLESQLAELKLNSPLIEIKALDDIENEIKNINIDISLYETFDELEIDNIVTRIIKKFPIVKDFSSYSKAPENSANDIIKITIKGMDEKFVPPTEEEIHEYQTEDYPAWIDRVSEYISNLPKAFEHKTRIVPISFQLENLGNVPAESVIVNFKAYGGILLICKNNKFEEIMNVLIDDFPCAPQAPKGQLQNRFSIFDSLRQRIYEQPQPPDFNIFNNNRDKNKFYCKTGNLDKPTDQIVFECDEFRHKYNCELQQFYLVVPNSINQNCNTAIECEFTSKNLPESSKHLVKIQINVFEKNSLDATEQFLVNNKILP